jgi:hypothetical protein
MHIAIWIIAAILIGLWSLLAWAMHALLGLAAGVGGMPADWYALINQLPGTLWLEVWWPGWRETLVLIAQWSGTLIGWLGSAGPVIVWVLWALGTGVLVLCAALLSGLVALARRAAPKVQAA